MMEHSYDIETKLTQIIYDYYVDSSDYNGLELYNLTVEYDTDTVVNALVRLIEENKIALIASAHDENPHIIRFGFPSIDEQICYLQSNRLDGYACLYPTETYLKENRDTQDVVPRYPFIHMIELGYPQLKACYFEWGILYKYFSDPRYKFHFSDYIGSISSTDAVDDNSIVNIKTFGIGKDENNNIDVTFFKSIGWNTIDDKGKTKGNLCCLKEWLHIVNSDIEDEITSPLRDLRKLRQNPAHKIEKKQV